MIDADFTQYTFQDDSLTGMLLLPQGRKVEKMVVLLHGYQGDALSNMPFARSLAGVLSKAIVIVPDGIAPVPNQQNPSVRQWWDLTVFKGEHASHLSTYAPESDQRSLHEMSLKANATAGILNDFIKRQLAFYGLSLKDCFIVGISQGGMTAFEMSLFRSELYQDEQGTFLGGVAIIGAGILYPDRLRKSEHNNIVPIPFLLVRGSQDEIFPKTVDCFSASILIENRLCVQRKEVVSSHYGLEHCAVSEVSSFLIEQF